MRSRDYGADVLATNRPRRPAAAEVLADAGLVVEERASGYCGAVVGVAPGGPDAPHGVATLEDRHGRHRVFPLLPAAFLLDGVPVTLVWPRAAPTAAAASSTPHRTASGSIAVPTGRARVARASRIYVEGKHDAELVEKVWGEDLRVEGVVVEALDGIDELPAIVRTFGPCPGRRLGVLVDHLVATSKERRLANAVAHPHVLVTGHPYVDIWQAVRPGVLGIAAWPVVPPGPPWKEGICAALGVAQPWQLWRQLLAGVTSYADLETPLLGAVERLIDFVTQSSGWPGSS